MTRFQKNDLIGLAMLFRLAAKNKQTVPGNVQVLVPVYDCERLAALLDAAADAAESEAA